MKYYNLKCTCFLSLPERSTYYTCTEYARYTWIIQDLHHKEWHNLKPNSQYMCKWHAWKCTIYAALAHLAEVQKAPAVILPNNY